MITHHLQTLETGDETRRAAGHDLGPATGFMDGLSGRPIAQLHLRADGNEHACPEFLGQGDCFRLAGINNHLEFCDRCCIPWWAI